MCHDGRAGALQGEHALDCFGHYSRDNNNCRGCAVAVECYEEREKGK